VSGLIVYVDHSDIRAGKLDELKRGMNELAAFVEANEPRTVAYNVYFNEEGTRMTVVHVHPNSASLEFHMRTAGPLFSGVASFITLMAIDIYGEPSSAAVEQLRRKAEALGTGEVRVHGRHAGFTRVQLG
jgi:hypothetical protein